MCQKIYFLKESVFVNLKNRIENMDRRVPVQNQNIVLNYTRALIYYFDIVEYNTCIMVTYPCNFHPLAHHFYIVKLGFTMVYIFSYFCSKTDSGYSLEPPHCEYSLK